MQLGRLIPKGLTALRLSSRVGPLTPRTPTLRGIRICVEAAKRSLETADEPEYEPRTPASRRTLFNGSGSSQPPEAGERPTTHRRDLAYIHKESLKDAGIKLSPYEIEQNRLQSLKQSLRRETRGAARAAVTKEFKVAEKRLYTTYRGRRRDGDNGDGEYGDRRSSRAYEDRREGRDYDDRRGGRGDYDDRRGGRENDDRRGGREFGDRRVSRDFDNRGGGREVDDRRGGREYDDRRGGREYDDRRGGREYDDRRGGRDFGNRGPGREVDNRRGGREDDQTWGGGEWDRHGSERGVQRLGREDWGERDGAPRPLRLRPEEDPRAARLRRKQEEKEERKQQRKIEKALRVRGPKPVKPRKKTQEEIEALHAKNRARASNTAALAVAAMRARRAAADPSAAAADEVEEDYEDGEDGDEDEMEEGEMGELYSLQDGIGSLRERAGRSDGPTPDLPTDKHVQIRMPKLTHNLPDDVNLRLLQGVMAGADTFPIPEIPAGASGLTRGLIAGIHLIWRKNEMVKIRIRDRRKTAKKYLPYIGKVCETLESMTGGVVVWRSGRSIWMYRGLNYQPQMPDDIRATFLNKRDVPVEGPLLSPAAPLLGQEVRVAQGVKGYLTRGSDTPAASTAPATNDGASPSDSASASDGASTSNGAPTTSTPAPASTDFAVLFLHDAFYGLNGAASQVRTKQACDRLSALLGAPVLVPDLHRGGQTAWKGKEWPPEKAVYERHVGWVGFRNEGKGSFPAVVADIDAAVAYLRGPEVGAKRLVLAGTGWGAWIAMHTVAADARAAAAELGIPDEAFLQRAREKAETKAAKSVKKEATKDAREVARKRGRADFFDKRNVAVDEEAVRAAKEAARKEWEEEERKKAEAADAAGWGRLWRGAEMVPGFAGQLVDKVQRGELDAGSAGLTFHAALVATAGHFFLDEENLARDLAVPAAFMSSKWDPMEKFQLHMNPPLLDRCAFKRFGKLVPGYLGRQANWEDRWQVEGASQALTLHANFVRWHLHGSQASEDFVRLYCMMGKSGVGEKQVYNLQFPWLEQVTLFRGREKMEKRAVEKARREAAEAAKKAEKPAASTVGRSSGGSKAVRGKKTAEEDEE